jgi:hypothetical protein
MAPFEQFLLVIYTLFILVFYPAWSMTKNQHEAKVRDVH